ncbi:MAG: S8 family serine peptidase [Candidatus Acidiferrales bacterium]
MHITENGEVQVYIELSAADSQNLDELRSYGVTVQIVGEPKPDKSKGEVLTNVPTVQGLLPVTMINQVSALSFVRYVRLPDYGFTNTGSVESQGDAILQAEAARSQFGVDGTGIRVGVISGGIGGIFAAGCTTCGPTTQTPSPITLGDLPNATGTRNSSGILTSVTGGIIAQSFPSSSPDLEDHTQPDGPAGVNAEGTAMLEIVHDLAPGAQLYFANAADGTSLSFELAVNFLAANTDVVVDDISFQIPPFDGTDPVSTNTATALNTDSNPIRGYFTAVDNFAQDHYEGQYIDSGTDGTSITGQAGDLHAFQAASGVTVDNENFGPSVADPTTVLPSGTIRVFLTWNDPANASSNDYDVFLVPLSCSGFSSTNRLPLPPCSISGAPLASSTNPQTGTQPPTEELSYTNPSAASSIAVAIVIQNVNKAAASRTFDMFIAGSLGDGANPDHNFNTVSGSVPAEGDASGSPVSVVSVGAIDQTQCSGPGNCVGSVEPYSSQGPTEATPQAAARMKPDVTATDDVTVTGAGGFGMNGPNGSNTGNCAIGETPCYFAGSSAAAPHAAAIAALTLQAAPCLLSSSSVNKPATARASLSNFLTGTAMPLPGIPEAVPNNIEGFGLLNALAAITATLPMPNAGSSQTLNGTSASGASVTLNGSATDPDSCPVTLSWTGSCGTASGASASLMCPIGNDTEIFTASNGGITTSLPTSTVQIAVSDFTTTVAQPTASVQPGQSATYTVTVGSQFGAFTNPVSLACSGEPSLTSCSFSPPSVTPGVGSANSTLTISTTSPSSVFPILPRGWPSLPLLCGWIGLLFSLFTGMILANKSGRKRAATIALATFLICLTSVVAACSSAGGGHVTTNPGTPSGSFTIAVTGSSNQLQHSMNVTLTVQ